MKKIRVADASGVVLDWMVATCEGRKPTHYKGEVRASGHPDFPGSPPMFGPEMKFSTDWALGGPIIERAGISVALRYGSLPPNHVHDVWDAIIKPEFYKTGRPKSGIKKEVIFSGPTPLIAAMRCYVASKLGDEVEVPEELLK